MNQTLEKRSDYNDEISLVDLATTFVRRRNVFYVVFIAFTLLGVAYALITPERYEYISLLQVAEIGAGEFVEQPSAVVATLENRWVPEAAASFEQLNEKKLPFRVKVSNPKDTDLIRIASEASPENAAVVARIHKQLIENVTGRQEQLLKVMVHSLNSQIASQEKVVESLSSMEHGESSAATLASALQMRAELESQIESLKPAQVLVESRQSTEKKGPARSLIVVLAVLLGVMGGVFLAFFSEFIAAVRANLSAGEED